MIKFTDYIPSNWKNSDCRKRYWATIIVLLVTVLVYDFAKDYSFIASFFLLAPLMMLAEKGASEILVDSIEKIIAYLLKFNEVVLLSIIFLVLFIFYIMPKIKICKILFPEKNVTS